MTSPEYSPTEGRLLKARIAHAEVLSQAPSKHWVTASLLLFVACMLAIFLEGPPLSTVLLAAEVGTVIAYIVLSARWRLRCGRAWEEVERAAIEQYRIR